MWFSDLYRKVKDFTSIKVQEFAIKNNFSTSDGFIEWASLNLMSKISSASIKRLDYDPVDKIKQKANLTMVMQACKLELQKIDEERAQLRPDKKISEEVALAYVMQEALKTGAFDNTPYQIEFENHHLFLNEKAESDLKNQSIKSGEYVAKMQFDEKTQEREKLLSPTYIPPDSASAKNEKSQFYLDFYNQNDARIKNKLSDFFKENESQLKTNEGRDVIANKLKDELLTGVFGEKRAEGLSRVLVYENCKGINANENSFTSTCCKTLASAYTKNQLENNEAYKKHTQGENRHEYVNFAQEQGALSNKEIASIKEQLRENPEDKILQAKLIACESNSRIWDVGEEQELKLEENKKQEQEKNNQQAQENTNERNQEESAIQEENKRIEEARQRAEEARRKFEEEMRLIEEQIRREEEEIKRQEEQQQNMRR